MTGGVTDQHDTVGEWRVGPRVVAGIVRARPGRCGGHDLLAPRVTGDAARGEELLGSRSTGEAMLSRQASTQIDAGTPTALVEHQEEHVALTRDDVVIVRHSV